MSLFFAVIKLDVSGEHSKGTTQFSHYPMGQSKAAMHTTGMTYTIPGQLEADPHKRP